MCAENEVIFIYLLSLCMKILHAIITQSFQALKLKLATMEANLLSLEQVDELKVVIYFVYQNLRILGQNL